MAFNEDGGGSGGGGVDSGGGSGAASGSAEPATNPTESFVYRYKFANVEFDESTGSLQVANTEVPVEPLPVNLLLELLRRPNEVVTRAELFESVWDGRPTVDHVLANAVNKLRKALGAEGAARLVNLPRVGYRLVGPVERSAVGRRSSAPLDLHPGDAVPGRDGLRLERPLGSAPNSAVWLARNAKLQCERVFKFAADADRLAALKREFTVYRVLKQELGERRDFARVLGANFSNAPYFLECEYGGPDLPAWTAEGDRLNALPQPERIALFLQIARAVAAAHGVGVLHKDLKPANVLIDIDRKDSAAGAGAGAERWVARLTDFGNSRLLLPGRLAELGVTAMGLTLTQGAGTRAMSGTPLYLAPELLAGQSPSTRSDLYALGLMLYQMLVGDLRRPMSTGWQRDIGDELLRDDLTAATEGRPEDRLGSVEELVERLTLLERRRADKAAQRRAAMQAEQAAAQLQRNRARRPWLAAVFACMALGLATSLWFYRQSNSALQRAEQESLRAQSINDFLNKDVLQSADVVRAGTHKTVSVLDVLQRASERASERFSAQPRTEASVRGQLGEIYLRMNFLANADQQFTKALALLEPLVTANDAELLSLRFGAARAWVGRFHPEKTTALLQRAERDAGPALLAETSALAVLAARARLDVLLDANNNTEALPTALRLVALSNAWPGADTALRFEARQQLADVYARLGDTPKANALLAEIMAPPFNENNVGDVLFARAKLLLARDRINANRFAEAEALLTEVRDTLTHAFGPNELHVGMANSELADLLQLQGRFAPAAQASHAAEAAFAGSLGETHAFVAITKINSAVIDLEAGKSGSALRALDETRPRIAENRNAATLLPAVDFARARALTDLGRAAESLAILKALDPALLADSSWGFVDAKWRVQAEQGRAYLQLGHSGEGLALLRPAVLEMAKAGAQPWQVARYQRLLPSTGRQSRK